MEYQSWETLENYIVKLLNNAKESGEVLIFRFNDIVFPVNMNDSVKEITDKYSELYDKRAVEQMKVDKKVSFEIEELEKPLIESYIENPPNFESDLNIIEWIVKVEKLHSVYGHRQEILDMFAENGFHPNENIDELFSFGDKENMLHWLVGQALKSVEEFGDIPNVIEIFIENYKEIFY